MPPRKIKLIEKNVKDEKNEKNINVDSDDVEKEVKKESKPESKPESTNQIKIVKTTIEPKKKIILKKPKVVEPTVKVVEPKEADDDDNEKNKKDVKDVKDEKEYKNKEESNIEKSSTSTKETKETKETKVKSNNQHLEHKKINASKQTESSFDMFGEDDVDFRYIMMNYDYTKNRTQPKITKYEKTLLIGKRAKQIEDGANANVKVMPGQSAIEIAEEELIQRKIPFIIKRPFGNTFEYWKPADMEVNMD